MENYLVMEYLYRDANNFKAWGSILLKGNISRHDYVKLKGCLDSGEFFVAEQVGIPVLYKELWKFSNGPTRADHAYHEFVDIRQATNEDLLSIPLWGNTNDLIDQFSKVNGKWDCSLSVHCN